MVERGVKNKNEIFSYLFNLYIFDFKIQTKIIEASFMEIISDNS